MEDKPRNDEFHLHLHFEHKEFNNFGSGNQAVDHSTIGSKEVKRSFEPINKVLRWIVGVVMNICSFYFPKDVP